MNTAEHLFSADLQTPLGVESGYPLPFASLEAACCDVYASLAFVASDLLSQGIDPMECAYLVCDEQGDLLVEIAFSELLPGRSRAPTRHDEADQARMSALADLRARSEAAISRMDRAAAWMNRLTVRALAVGS